MSNTNLPNIVTTLTDGNLNTRTAVNLGDRIILLGTAERGPVNEDRAVTSVTQAEALFGDVSIGNLVRGFTETYYAPGGPKDIRLVRISNGNTASLDVPELPGSGLTRMSATDVACTIAARYPGEPYNQASIRQDVENNQLSVVFYNPVTGNETVIPYDPAGLVAGSVSNTEQLVNALNLDTNFASDFEASTNYLTQSFTLTVNPTQAWVTSSGNYAAPSGTITIDLSAALLKADTDGDSITEDASIVTPGTPVTCGNNLVSILESYSNESQLVQLASAGQSLVSLPDPTQTLNGVAYDFLKQDLTTDSVANGQAVHIFVGSFIGTGDGSSTSFRFTAYEPVNPATLTVYRTGPSGQPIVVTGVTLDIAGGSSTGNIAQISVPQEIPLNHVLTADFHTLQFPLTKVTTLTSLQASTSYGTYYVAGNKVYFGAAQPADIQIGYKARKIFTDGNEVALFNKATGEIIFQDLSRLPDIWAAGGANIFFNVKFLPEWVNLTGGALSLTGGTSDVGMTNAQKFIALTSAYDALADTASEIVVPIDTYVDDTKVDFDSETGVQTLVNAGFTEQLNTYVSQLLDGVSETFGVIAVKPIVPADGRSVKSADITTYIDRLTTFSFSDVTRAANVMRNLDAKQLDVIAFEPIISNPTIRQPYSTNGAALYAGLIAKLDSSSAATNKPLTGIVGLNYILSFRQLNTLTGARYVTAMQRPGLGIVITDGVTAAATTSDWVRRSTWRIVVEAMKNVRQVGMPFIGEGFSGAKKAALDTAILRQLDGMKNDGKLIDYDWQITQTASQEVQGIADVRLILHPAFELRRLEVTVELRQS